MRRTLALLMTTWVGIVIAYLVALIEVIVLSGLLSLTEISMRNEWWPIWWLIILANSILLGVIYSHWIEGLRAEGKEILATKLDSDPEETVG